MRIGLVPRIELRIGLNSFVVESRPGNDESGFEDSFIGAKIRLVGPGSSASPLRPAVAVLLGTQLPTGEDGLGSDGIGPGGTVALAWDLGRWVALGSNVGLASLEQDGERFEQVSASASVGVGLAERLGAYVELFGFSKQGPGGSEDIFVNGGLTFLASTDLQFDARTGFGLDDSAPDYFVGAGFVWRVRY